jgi:hypothetical protein
VKEIVPTTRDHLVELASTMRQADVDEVWASNHHTPEEALDRSFRLSDEPFTGLVDGEVVCIFGVAQPTPLADNGSPWLLASDLVEEHAHTFLRVNRVYVKEIRKRYPLLENYVDCRNTASIRWLKWLGFKFDKPAPYGPDGLPFLRFEYRRD